MNLLEYKLKDCFQGIEIVNMGRNKVIVRRVRRERLLLSFFTESKKLQDLMDIEKSVPWYMIKKKYFAQKKVAEQNKVFIKSLNKLREYDNNR